MAVVSRGESLSQDTERTAPNLITMLPVSFSFCSSANIILYFCPHSDSACNHIHTARFWSTASLTQSFTVALSLHSQSWTLLKRGVFHCLLSMLDCGTVITPCEFRNLCKVHTGRCSACTQGWYSQGPCERAIGESTRGSYFSCDLHLWRECLLHV